mgnify:CR=1 FL=1
MPPVSDVFVKFLPPVSDAFVSLKFHNDDSKVSILLFNSSDLDILIHLTTNLFFSLEIVKTSDGLL